MSCSCNAITVSSISFNNTSGLVVTNNDGSGFLVSDGGLNLKFYTISNTVSDTANSGYSLTILNSFQGKITQNLNNTNAGTDTATLTGTIQLTTPNVINNTNPTFVVNGNLACDNFIVFNSSGNPLSLTITLDSSTIFGSSTYEGVVSFTVTISGNQLLGHNQEEPVTLTAKIGSNNTLCLNITDIINNASNQILNSLDSIVSKINKISSSIDSGIKSITDSAKSIDSAIDKLSGLEKSIDKSIKSLLGLESSIDKSIHSLSDSLNKFINQSQNNFNSIDKSLNQLKKILDDLLPSNNIIRVLS